MQHLLNYFSIHLICTALLVSHSILTQEPPPRQITYKQEWYISSPPLKRTQNHTTKTAPRDQSPIESLHAIGAQAHTTWHDIPHSQQRIIQFDSLFKPVDRTFLSKTIDQIINDDMLLKKVARASYRNVIGFLKVVLATGEGDNAWKIRLHVWQQKDEKEFPHNHKWDFYSKIIAGYLAQDLFKKEQTSDSCPTAHSVRQPVSLMPVDEHGQLPCPCRDNYRLDAKDGETVSLTKHTTDIIGTGESYIMPRHLVHAINPSKGSMSLVFTSEKITDNSEVFVPMDKVETDLSRFAPSVTPEELRSELVNVQKMLKQLYVHEHYLPEMVHPSHHYYRVNNGDSIVSSPSWRSALHDNTRRKRVLQLSEYELPQYIISATEHGHVCIDGTAIDPQNDYLFVLTNNVMYATPKDFNHESSELICHTSFSDYGAVDSAGVLRFDADGTLRTIEAYSGHYCPSLDDMHSAYDHLKKLGITMTNATISTYEDRI